jgi:hypothetical protein
MGQHSTDTPVAIGQAQSHGPDARPVVKATPDQAGCWLDGAMGWHNSYRVVDVAVARGWPITVEDAATADRYQASGGTTDYEVIDDMVRDATDWLTDNVAPDGYTFEWVDGDLVLWSEEASCEASGDRCQDPNHTHTAR